MVDIHTHILPGVDDGAADIEMALRLIRHAAAGGTREIFLTPHCAPSYGFYNYDGEELAGQFDRLCRAVYQKEQIPVRLHPGMEDLYEGREDLLRHQDENYPLCGSRYLLMEYYFDVEGEQFLEGIDTLQECGYVPVIAHPERYECVWKYPELLKEGRKKGALFQMNKGSLSGRHGGDAGKTAEWMLDEDLADFIASDAHHPVHRDSGLKYVAEYVRRYYGKEKMYRIFIKNPECIIRDKLIRTE